MSMVWNPTVGWVCDDCEAAFQTVREAEVHEGGCEGAFDIEVQGGG